MRSHPPATHRRPRRHPRSQPSQPAKRRDRLPVERDGIERHGNRTVNPNGHATTYYFRYGPTTAYGFQTNPADAGSGKATVAVHATFYGLTANTTYHYQLVAQNSAGTTTARIRR